MELEVAAATSFRVLEAEGSERLEWLALLDSWANREVFAHPDYLSLFKKAGDKPICLVYTCPEGRVIHPLILRDLRATDFWGSERDELYDTIAPPYGYGGPFVEGGSRSKIVAEFFREFEEWALSRNIVSDYATFSPKEEAPLSYPGDVATKMPSVVRTLDVSPQKIFSDYKDTLQRHVRGAMRAGVEVQIDETGELSHQFLPLYEDTMKRTNADPSYHLSRDFLERVNRTLSGYLAYFYALLDGMVVSTELVLVSGDSTFFFRGGTSAEAFHAKPNHLLKHNIILWSHERGKKFYILGGGNSGEDSLYRYKLSFAPRGARALRVGKWRVNPTRYQELVAARTAYETSRGVAWVPKTGYFPEYRAP